MYEIDASKLPDLGEVDSAKGYFHKQALWRRISWFLLSLMVPQAVWNVNVYLSFMDGKIYDLVDIFSLRSHPVAYLTYALGAITLTVFIYGEWRHGEHTGAYIYTFMSFWLALILSPVLTDELLGRTEKQDVTLRMFYCDEGAVVNRELLDNHLCKIQAPNPDDVRITLGDPATKQEPLQEPYRIFRGGAHWMITGRTNYALYYLVKQDSMAACEALASSDEMVRIGVRYQQVREPTCVERDDAIWLVTHWSRSPLVDFYIVGEP